MKKHISIGRFAWRRWRWLAMLALVCLVLAPVLSTADMAAAFAAPVQEHTAAVVHHHADGKAHEHRAAAHHHDDSAKAAKTDDGKTHSACADGCCLGKGCPLCGLGLVVGGVIAGWSSPGCFGFVPVATAVGIVPPPPSEPPRV